MDIREQCKQLKEEILNMSNEEKNLRASIAEYKSLLIEKEKRQDSIKALKEEEAELLKALKE